MEAAEAGGISVPPAGGPIDLRADGAAMSDLTVITRAVGQQEPSRTGLVAGVAGVPPENSTCRD